LLDLLGLGDQRFRRYIFVYASVLVACIALLILRVHPFFFGGVSELAISYTGCLPHSLVNTILDETSKLDTNAFSVLNDFPVAKDSIDLGSGNLLCIST
jgi:hypothetical protein